MATAMATAVNPLPIDPSKGARIPVKISQELLQEEDNPRKKQKISVQYNHWPKSVSAGRSAITPNTAGNESLYTLTVEGSGSGSGTYDYEGVQRPAKTVTRALFYNPADKSFILDQIDTEFLFNLHSTPSQKNAAALSTQYPQLDTGAGQTRQHVDELFDDAGEDGDNEAPPPDPSNPYDYRHFLNRAYSPSPAPSAVSSPVPNHQHHFTSSPATQPLAAAKPRQKKSKDSEGPRYLPSVPTQEEPEGVNEEHDPNELVIDMGDAPQKPWRSALGILNEGGRNSGPISLRSAASSMSPSIRSESDSEKDEEKLGEAGQDEDEDDDVEEIDLGDSAADSALPHEEAATPGNGWDDAQDEMEAELEEALGKQADDEDAERESEGVTLNGPHRSPEVNTNVSPPVDDSSSESEEE